MVFTFQDLFNMSKEMNNCVAIRYRIRGDTKNNRYHYRRPGEKFSDFEQRFYIKLFTLGYVAETIKYVCEYDYI